MDRPFVFLNVAMTVDGRIGLPSRQLVGLGSMEDRRRMSILRSQADAVVVGGATFRAYRRPLVENPKYFPEAPPRHTPVWNVVVTRHFDLPVDARAFHDERVRLLVIGQKDAPAEQVQQVATRAEVVQAETVTPELVLEALAKRGARRVLLESGGNLTGAFVRAGLLDELYVTVVPRILAGEGAPTPVDGPGFSMDDAPRLSLLKVEQVQDELFLHYRRVG